MNFQFDEPEIIAPSISSSAMLASLSISLWAGRKKDVAASVGVASDNGAEIGVTNVTKKLLGDCPELDAVKKNANAIGALHRSMTMPWSDDIARLLTTAKYFDHHQKVTALIAKAEASVETFLAVYDWAVTEAQVKLGSLYIPDEYPSADNLRKKFSFRLNYTPVPEVGDWRVEMEDATQDSLRRQYASFYSEQVNAATNDLLKRLLGELARFVSQLSIDDEGVKGKIYDGTLEHVMSLTDMLASANFSGNPDITAAEERIRNTLTGVTRTDLLKDEMLRADTKRALQAAIDALPGLGM